LSEQTCRHQNIQRRSRFPTLRRRVLVLGRKSSRAPQARGCEGSEGVHGYGSSGKGGRSATVAQIVRDAQEEGVLSRISSPRIFDFSPDGAALLETVPELRGDTDLSADQ